MVKKIHMTFNYGRISISIKFTCIPYQSTKFFPYQLLKFSIPLVLSCVYISQITLFDHQHLRTLFQSPNWFESNIGMRCEAEINF